MGISVFLLEPHTGPVEARHYSSSLAGASAIHPDFIGTAQGLKVVVDLVKSVSARALLANDDKILLWLARNRAAFEPGCAVLASSAESLQRLFDKRNQIELAKKSGFTVLPTWLIESVGDVHQIAVEHFPVCIRPSRLDSVQPNFKAEVLDSSLALTHFVQSLSVIREQLIVQPFVSGPNLVVHGVRSPGGQITAMKAFIAYRKHQGFTLALRPERLSPELELCCRKFAELSDLSGSFHYDLLVSSEDGKVYFLEVNARLGGTTDKVWRLGFDEPGALLEAFGVTPVLAQTRQTPTVPFVVGKRLMAHNLIAALRGRLPVIDFPHTGRTLQVLYSVWAILFFHDSVLDWSDVRGGIWYLFYKRAHTLTLIKTQPASISNDNGNQLTRAARPRDEQ